MNIENDYLRVSARKEGGSLTSIYDEEMDEELLYQPLSNSWQGQDVFIFPFIARLVDGTYEYEGKTYSLKNHGLLRYMVAKEEQIKQNIMRFTFKSSKETLSQYPFEFEAQITYKVIRKNLFVSYVIKNLSGKDMPFMSGNHPAFALPGEADGYHEFDMSGNYIEFDTEGDVTALLQEETFSFMTGEKISLPNRIELSKDLFNRINTIIVQAGKIKTVRLVKSDGSVLTMDKGNAPYIALWSDKKFGNYVCIEPWFGVPDYVNCPKNIIRKKEIQNLRSGCSFEYRYKLSFD